MAALPHYLATAEDRCDEACYATQPFGIAKAGGNAQVAYLLHLAADPNCKNCNTYPNRRPSAEEVYLIIASIVEKARASAK